MGNNAVGTERIARVTGWKLAKGNFAESSPNLPQRIAILGEGNTLNQASFDGQPVEITSAKQAGTIFGYGSPIHMMMRMLRPTNSDGVGGIPTIVYPQMEEVGFTSSKFTITVTGTATGNTTNQAKIGGRTSVDGLFYNVNIVKNNTPTQIAVKLAASINAVLGSPFKATSAGAVVTIESKWKGLTAEGISVEMVLGDSVGVSYAILNTQAGSGTPDVQAALDLFENNWNTIVLNGYNIQSDVCDTLEAFNGKPDDENPTGRYAGIVMKPFIALCGSTSDDETVFTDARLDECTISVVTAPKAKVLPFEVGAAWCLKFARNAQDTPHLDIAGRFLEDIPVDLPLSIAMNDYNNRDNFVKKGLSTVTLVGDQYKIEDFVTTYHPEGEVVPQFRYCRNLMLDYNVRFSYYLLEQIHVVDHVIVNDDDIVQATKIVKPKQWKAVVTKMATDLTLRGLLVDADFTSNSLVVGISTTNPDRLETEFDYKRSGIARIASTQARAGFNFGTVQ